jgi:signal peptidase I
MESVKKSKIMNYIGTSMNPVLKPGDRLQVNPGDREKIRRGDVVIFIPPGGISKIVHRVTSVNSDGIKTRGDNCNYADEWVLDRENILGRVVAAQRGNRRLRVFGGPLGHYLAMAIRAIQSVDSIFSPLLHPYYQQLANGGAFRRRLPNRMRPRVISVNRDAATELQLVMGRFVIGRWLPGKTRWHIRRPFRLFVDEESLPENAGKASVVRGSA